MQQAARLPVRAQRGRQGTFRRRLRLALSAYPFLAPYLIEGMPPLDPHVWQYSPWLTAKVSGAQPP